MLCSSDPAITTAVRRPSLIDKIIIFGNERKFVRRILDCCVPPTHTPVQRAPTAPIAMRRSSLLLWHERQTHAAQQPIYRSGKMCWCWVCVRRICRVALPYIRKQKKITITKPYTPDSSFNKRVCHMRLEFLSKSQFVMPSVET